MVNTQKDAFIVIRHDNDDGLTSNMCVFLNEDDAIKCCRKYNLKSGKGVDLTPEGDVVESDANYTKMYNDTSIWYEVDKTVLNSEFEE